MRLKFLINCLLDTERASFRGKTDDFVYIVLANQLESGFIKLRIIDIAGIAGIFSGITAVLGVAGLH